VHPFTAARMEQVLEWADLADVGSGLGSCLTLSGYAAESRHLPRLEDDTTQRALLLRRFWPRWSWRQRFAGADDGREVLWLGFSTCPESAQIGLSSLGIRAVSSACGTEHRSSWPVPRPTDQTHSFWA
jgi:hypothetical protein